MNTMVGMAGRRAYLVAEFAVVFGVVPAAVLLWPRPRPIIAMLVAIAGVCLAVLLMDRRFGRRRLGWGRGWAAVRRELPGIVLRWAVAGVGLAVMVPLLPRAQWLGFVRHRPGMWAAVMVLYPLLSVYPQELIFRAFLMHRYRAILPRPRMMLLASAAAFGWAHVVLDNMVAIVLCLIGGCLFARTYLRTRSLLAASLEHALYGDLVFTLGLGWYFYGGAVR